MPSSFAVAALAAPLAAMPLLGLVMATGTLRLSGRLHHGQGRLRLTLAALGLLALVTFADTGLIAVGAVAKGLGAG